MGRVGLALKAFWGILVGAVAPEQAQVLLNPTSDQKAVTNVPKQTSPPQSKSVAQPSSRRSDAITLLASLQREARFVDLVQEPLSEYTNEQIGAAARDVLRDCHGVLERMFSLAPIIDATEGAQVETPSEFSSGKIKVTGSTTGDPPFHGRLVHHGWRATRVDVPTWSGEADAEKVVGPAEVEC